MTTRKKNVTVEKTVNGALAVQVGGDHYKKLAIQPVEYTVRNRLDFLQGNVVKYVTRHKDKGGAKDMQKVIHYALLILEFDYGISAPPELTELLQSLGEAG